MTPSTTTTSIRISSMGDSDGKWAAGASYGPVLSQMELHMLNTKLEIHPILANCHGSFRLVFNLATGQTSGFNHDARDQDLPFTAREEPATLPRVEQLMIITQSSPWCTTVENPSGVTLSDVYSQLWKDYTEQLVTEAEFNSLPPRIQEHVKQTAAHNRQAGSHWGMYSNLVHATPPNRYKRIDWLRERIFFETLRKNDEYAISRLGFKAPNIFIMDLLN